MIFQKENPKKKPHMVSTNSPATSDLFEPDSYEENASINAKNTINAGANFGSPATSNLFDAVSEPSGELSPNASDLFGPLLESENKESSASPLVHECEPLASDIDDFGCVPLADSGDEEEQLSSTGKLYFQVSFTSFIL